MKQKKQKIAMWEVKVCFKVRTKKQAKILDKAMIDTYAKLASEWTGTTVEDMKLRFGIKV